MKQFLTTYTKDYTTKKVSYKGRVPAALQEFSDPISESFKHYLDYTDRSPPHPKEYVEDYAELLKKKREKVGERYLSTPLNTDILDNENARLKKTTYREDYIYSDGSYEDPFAKIHILIPPGAKLPETTQSDAYRDPRSLWDEAKIRTKPIRGKNSLGPNEKINDILKVKTGLSEYEAIIGTLGTEIIEEQVHGKVIHY